MRARRLFALVPAVALVAVAGVTGATAGDGRPSHIEVVAEFDDAGAILSGNDVRVDGVLAGTVKKITLVDNKARLTLR
ncbi:MAG: MlaD family protein, partial [Acidimicrobiia bacterium]